MHQKCGIEIILDLNCLDKQYAQDLHFIKTFEYLAEVENKRIKVIDQLNENIMGPAFTLSRSVIQNKVHQMNPSIWYTVSVPFWHG